LWDEIYQLLKQNGFYIRGIWIADVPNMGMSAALNEHKIGTDCKSLFAWKLVASLLSKVSRFVD
jgi:hypothetical protein